MQTTISLNQKLYSAVKHSKDLHVYDEDNDKYVHLKITKEKTI